LSYLVNNGQTVIDRIGGVVLSTITSTSNIGLVKQVLKKLKRSTSTEWDGIPNMFPTKCATTLHTSVIF